LPAKSPAIQTKHGEALSVCDANPREVESICAKLRRRMSADPPETSGIERVERFCVRINDAMNFYMLFKDVFCRRIYDFQTNRDDPVILDCGANIGMGVMYFKHRWPRARINAFEPDRAVLPLLRENLSANGMTNVHVVEAALSASSTPRSFRGDGRYGGHLNSVGDARAPGSKTGNESGNEASADETYTVPCVRLRDYLDGPVDFLKMNIEGAEWEVLSDCRDRLARVAAMAIEYHHLPGLPRRLHRILELLDDTGFDCIVHSYDAETNPHGQPPFRIHRNTSYYALLAAVQRDWQR